jgi:AraC-type DNA-binding domain-containing proteins
MEGGLVEIDKKVFETYFFKHKPYLNPNFRISDLIDPLQSNRTYISKFINRTYKMNFSSYVNHCRLREMERLLQLPMNKGKKMSEIIVQAGFSNYRNYLRAKKQFSMDTKKTNG